MTWNDNYLIKGENGMSTSIKKDAKRDLIITITVVIVSICAIVGTIIAKKISQNTAMETASVETISNQGSKQKFDMKEEVIEDVKEDIIRVRKDTSASEKANEEKEGEVTVGDKKIEVPKSTVAPVNSAEDAEAGKKNGGEAVSQTQAESMFENVGTKSFGIDVSAHNGKINWAAVKASGVDFAIIRCGFRGQSVGKIYEDAYFKTNVSGAIANGVKVGIYFYSTAINENEAFEEAAWVISKIKTYRITYPVVYDFEDFGAYRCSGVGGAQATSNAHTYLNLVRSAGYEPMMYANKSDITSRMSRGSFSCKFWLAHYTTQTDYKGNYNMWQYTSRGRVNGINGNVDMNIAYFSYGATAEAKHAHDFSELVKNSQKDPTCTQDGQKVMRCSCGDTETQTIPKLGHKFSEWKVEKKATETEEGLKTRKCATCGTVEEEKIPKIKNQSSSNSSSSNANNTNTIGNETDSETNNENSTSGNTQTSGTTNPEPHVHQYTDYVVTKEPTCTEKGKKTRNCVDGDDVQEEEIDALGHNYENGACTRCSSPDPNVDNSSNTGNDGE